MQIMQYAMDRCIIFSFFLINLKFSDHKIKHFEMNILMAFSSFKVMCATTSTSKIFLLSTNKNLYPWSSYSSILLSLVPGNFQSAFFPMDLPSLSISYK